MYRKSQCKRFIQIDQYQVDLTECLGSGSCGYVYLGYYASRNSGKDKSLLAIKSIPLRQKT